MISNFETGTRSNYDCYGRESTASTYPYFLNNAFNDVKWLIDEINKPSGKYFLFHIEKAERKMMLPGNLKLDFKHKNKIIKKQEKLFKDLKSKETKKREKFKFQSRKS